MNKSMYEEIMRVVYDYAINNKPINRKSIEKIISIIVSYECLNDYVRDLKIYTKIGIPGCATTYDAENREMHVGREELVECVNMILSEKSMSPFERLLYVYEFVANSILHELIHARQEKEKNEKRGIKEKILRLSVCFVASNNEMKNMTLDEKTRYLEEKGSLWRKYQEYHDYAPCEREAHIEESALDLFVTTELNKALKCLDTLLCQSAKMLKRDFLLGYNEGLVPANHYFEQLGLSNEWGLLLPETKSLSTEEKVIYGLDVPIEAVKKEHDRFVRQRLL